MTIDVNVLMPPWPFRHTPVNDATELSRALAERGIVAAWVGSAESCFDRDVAGANRRLTRACHEAREAKLIPWGTVNPLAPDWRDDIRRCHEQHGMPGLRLTPACHGYGLDDARLTEALNLAGERGMIVSIILDFEDVRTQHPVFRIPRLSGAPLASLIQAQPTTKIVLLNAWRSISLEDAGKLVAAGDVYFDLAMLEGVDRLTQLVEHVGSERVLFGSWYPLFYVESALLKLRESQIASDVLERIHRKNAARLIGSE